MDIEDLNNTINKLNSYRTFHKIIADFILYSNAQGIFIKIN